MMTDLPVHPFAAVRASCARVVTAAELVEIDEARIDGYAAELVATPPSATDDPARRPHGGAEETCAYVLALDAVNFGSGWFPVLHKPTGTAGYFLIAGALEAASPITADWLAAAEPAGIAALLGQEGNAAAAPFVAEVAGALADLGQLLLDGYRGSAAAFVESAEHSAARLVRQLLAMPRFRDAADYRGTPVWFLKRAQITAADLTAALGDHPLGRFDDLHSLTVFADNLLPHVLRTDDVLRYRPGLAAGVDGGDELAAGSPAEVEIRAATVHAGELLRTAVAVKLGRPVNAAELDWWLWARGQGERYRQNPRHRTRSVYY